VQKNISVAGLLAPESVEPRDSSAAGLLVPPSEKNLTLVDHDRAPVAALGMAIESLMRVSGIGLRRESDRAGYAAALDAVSQAARRAERQDLFEVSLHVADNLAVLHSRPETRAAALLPMLDLPAVMYDWFEHPTHSESAELLLACLADPTWPQPLAAAAASRLRGLFVQADADARAAPCVASSCLRPAR
jgi:hypothetical protein